MVHKRKDRPLEGYRLKRKLPAPWNVTVYWQTGLRRKDQAEKVDQWVKEMCLTRPALIDELLKEKPAFNLQEAWIAKLRGTLDELLLGIGDPFLKDAVEKFKPKCKDARAQTGLDQLLKFAEPGVRLSWLAGENIRTLYEKAEESGMKPNSIQRGLHRAVRELLLYKLMDDDAVTLRFKGVLVPGEDDTRVVQTVQGDVRRVIDECVPDDFRWLVIAAIATAVDEKPLLAMTPRDVDELELTASIFDTKNTTRRRLIRLSDMALLAFRMASRGKELHERLWPWTRNQVRHMWQSARDRAAGRPSRGLRAMRGRSKQIDPMPDPVGDAAMKLLLEQKVVTLPVLRFKDLRHLLPTALAELGYDRREIQSYIGHTRGSRQTDRYITPTGDVRMLNEAGTKLGLDGAWLRAVGE